MINYTRWRRDYLELSSRIQQRFNALFEWSRGYCTLILMKWSRTRLFRRTYSRPTPGFHSLLNLSHVEPCFITRCWPLYSSIIESVIRIQPPLFYIWQSWLYSSHLTTSSRSSLYHTHLATIRIHSTPFGSSTKKHCATNRSRSGEHLRPLRTPVGPV